MISGPYFENLVRHVTFDAEIVQCCLKKCFMINAQSSIW